MALRTSSRSGEIRGGSVRMRAKTHFEDLAKRRAIIVDELPFQVNKARLLQQIADLGPALISDDAWKSLFGLGDSHHNGVTVSLSEATLGVDPVSTDQLGNPRPANIRGDTGAIETASE